MTKPAGWGRLLTAMITPFDEQLEINHAVAAQLARHLAATGSDGIVVGGTTGESPSLTADEKAALLETVLGAVGDKVTVIAGTGTNSTRESIEMTRRAERLGAHGIMLVTPYYNKPPQAGLVAHFKAIAAETSLPVMLYNVPGRTSVNLLPPAVEQLATVDNIVALKEAAGSTDQATEVLRRVPEGFLVYSGDDSLTLPLLSVGAYGIVSVASHVAGRQIAEMIRLYVEGDTEGAARAHRRLYPVFKGLFLTTNPIPVKAAVGMLGIAAGSPRLPLVELTAHEREQVVAAMREAGCLPNQAKNEQGVDRQ